ncbi:class I SAM-dependent methyltransferase [Rhodococcoides yunnanense]|uniref:Class I SAM-dependent methyltransferase n=1 Tax=Rhodococcoides yunnanense TaxID=278209 RepID=A0ABU4B8G1_9NOCA|nr:class I SAM-dependent methyltransferase [Rhodococcus yunnanensis]MDV6260485.1 class I SAM-dependent methyltransferase [Rhodococcus yunnanensis]
MPEDVRPERGLTFGRVAEDYDRARPGYPAELYADIATGGRLRVLEAGAGTGKATVAFAELGASVVAVEPDSEMADVVRRRTEHLDVEVQVSRFEECAVEPASFDVVVAAQAWHWVNHEQGAAVAARALVPGGALRLWWNMPGDLGGPAWDAVRAAYDATEPEAAPLLARSLGAQSESTVPRADGFGPWSSSTYRWVQRYTADEFCAMAATYSGHLILDDERRSEVLNSVHAAITEYGHVDYHYVTQMMTARRDQKG